MAHRTRPRRRSWLLSTNLIQTALMFLAACLCWTSTSKDLTSASALVVVGHLAFAASGQTSLAVTVGLPELNTTMVTGAIVSMRPSSQNVNSQLTRVSRSRLSTILDYRKAITQRETAVCFISCPTHLGALSGPL
jgi:uncharacterized membrane protein YoaK (UPF0700 family)